jgi:hypothetical protein
MKIKINNTDELNCERCGDRLQVCCAWCFTSFCDGCYEEIQELISESETQRAALAWLDDTADLDNAGDSLAYTVLTNILDGRGPAASPAFVKHVADWLSDACDLDNEYDALAYDFFSELLN